MAIEALILDFDGLIIDSEIAVAQAWRELFERFGAPFPERVWLTMVGTRENDGALWEELRRAAGRPIDAEALEASRRRRGVELADELPMLPGVADLIEDARFAGLRLAVASSSSCWWVTGHLERLGIADRFEAVRAREDAARSKPFPDVYEAALGALGVEPEAAVAFEDSEPGVRAARAAGLRVVAVPGSFTDLMDFSAADLVVDSLDRFDLGTLIGRPRC